MQKVAFREKREKYVGTDFPLTLIDPAECEAGMLPVQSASGRSHFIYRVVQKKAECSSCIQYTLRLHSTSFYLIIAIFSLKSADGCGQRL
jgi:hypothetical protein